MKKQRTDLCAIILGMLYLMSALLYISPWLFFNGSISRALISLSISAFISVYIAILIFLRNRGKYLVFGIVLNLCGSFYMGVLAANSSGAYGPYIFTGFNPLFKWLARKGAPLSFLLESVPMLIILALLLCGNDRNTGHPKKSAKIIWCVPGIWSFFYYAWYAARSAAILPERYQHLMNPLDFWMLGHGFDESSILTSMTVIIWMVLKVASAFVMGYWLISSMGKSSSRHEENIQEGEGKWQQ